MKYTVILLLISLSVSVQAADYRAYYQNYYQNYSYQNGYYPANAQPSYYQSNRGVNSYTAPAYQPRYKSHYGYSYYQQAYPKAYTPYSESTTPEKNASTSPSAAKKVVIKTRGKQVTINKKKRLKDKSINKAVNNRQQFFDQILPLVLNENQRINKNRKRLLSTLEKLQKGQFLTKESSQWLKQLARKYQVKGEILKQESLQQELLKRVGTIAPSMALAQAANESAWGTSRFSKLGNNLFGIWTYDPDIGIKPLNREPGKKHFVRKFSSFQDSVSVYIHTLNTHSAYKKLRNIRHEAFLEGRKPTGHELADGLEKYSAKGQEYIQMIQSMILRNNLDKLTQFNLAYK